MGIESGDLFLASLLGKRREVVGIIATGGSEEKQWVVFKSERNLNMSMAEGMEPKRGEGKGQVETIPWSLDWTEREEVGCGPQMGGWTDQEEESLAFRHEGRG